ncbi:MAG: T9SS type A sorting domain-containing protein [Bacteroidia bacterium]|nr:T9SS type A sorting domain-containing protein [Bacteroidia bacterium]
MNLGASVVRLKNTLNFYNSNNFTFNAGTSTILFIDDTYNSPSFEGGGNTFYNVIFEDPDAPPVIYQNNIFNKLIFTGSANIHNSNTFDTLIFSPGYNYTLWENGTQTINKYFSAVGSPGLPISINSAVPGISSTLYKNGGYVCADFLLLKDIHAAGGTFYAGPGPSGPNSYNNGNVTGWIFTACPGPLSITVSGSNSLCNGSCDGSATATTIQGIPPFAYLWNDPVSQTDSIAAGLCAGTYIVRVIDMASDTIIDTVVVAEPDLLTASITPANLFCYGEHNGTADLTASGGIIPYTYLWSDGDTTQDLNNIPAGAYSVTVTDANLCTAISMVNITQPALISHPVIASICSGESYFAGGSNQTNSGIYYDTLNAVNGCDSVIVTTLTVNPTYNMTVTAAICSGGNIFLQGAYQTTAGTYYDTLATVNGCDSMIITTLTVNPIYNTSAMALICSGDSILLQGTYQTTAGNYYDTLATMNGCDSVIVTTLTVNATPPVPSIIQDSAALICTISGMNIYQWFLNGNPWTNCISDSCTCGQDGIYNVIITDSNGCIASSNNFNINCTVGINETNQFTGINLYPIPNKGTFTLAFTGIQDNGAEISVLNILGETVYFEKTSIIGNQLMKEIELGKISTGIYLVQVKAGEKQLSKKLIIE